jgi:Pvc16 N-terminal domain
VSSPLAIGAASAVLRNLLDNGIVDEVPLGTTVSVTALAPDLIKLDRPQDPPQLNVFLFQATPNAALRNNMLPSRSASGDRMANAPLALDLHYLITAYGKSDFQAEILLGYAMHLLHERSMLDRAAIRRALNPPGTLDLSMLPPEYQLLSASDLADQVEALRIVPAVMSIEEMSKLWAALQSHYRPSAVYQVSVVLIEAKRPARNPLPVLSRGPVDATTQRDRGVVVNADLLPPLPTLFEVVLANKQSVARLGESITVRGIRLAGSAATVQLSHRLIAAPIEIAVTPNVAGTEFSFTLPNNAIDQTRFAPGLWQLSLRVTPPGELTPRITNGIALAIAADPVLADDLALGLVAASAVRGGATTVDGIPPPQVTVTVFTRPQMRIGQVASLSLDGVSANARARTNAASPLVFVFDNSLAAGARWVRLRVDGIDSPLVRRSGPAPDFDPSQRMTVPA